MLPSGHYSQYITSGLCLQREIDLVVYADMDRKNLRLKHCGKIKRVWSKSLKFVSEIIREVDKDKPDIIHIQHEINMFGSLATALVFPWLIFLLRMKRYKIVVTVHAAVYKKQIDKNFIKLFHKEGVRPVFLRMFFSFLYKFISMFSNAIIVHTNLTKKILTTDYGVSKKKVNVVPAAIPQKLDIAEKKKIKSPYPYFFYFGYMVRRKGLGFALEGFRKFIARNPKSKFKFVLAGGVIKGQEKALDEIKEMIAKNQFEDRILLKGFIEESEQDGLYANAYAVVIPAIISLGSSGPLYHAESYGKCVIATKVDHFLEDIDDKKTGILIQNDKWDLAFQSAVENPALVRRIEKNVAVKTKSRSPLATAGKYVKIYQEALDG